jgi:GT2 family glycosyltransferase
MQLSVVILNYNVKHFLQLCLQSVTKALKDIEGEIIVVDNNSADDSCSMVRSLFPEVILIPNSDNLGFPKGNNIGVDQAKGEYICILNPDTVVAEDTFEKILGFIGSKTDAGIVGCRLIDGSGRFLPESKRGIPLPSVAFYKVTGLYRISKSLNQYYAAHLPESQSGKVDILVGAFMVMKRRLYQELGGFDENCFMYSDDIDLSYSVLNSGLSNYYFASTSVIHFKGESTIKDGTYMKRFRDAMEFFYRKHFRVSALFSAFMQIGIVFFSGIKMIRGRQRQKPSPDRYLLVSQDDVLRDRISRVVSSAVMLSGKEDLASLISQTIARKERLRIIFDCKYVSYFEIINTMDTCSSAFLTFRLIPQEADFMIGSDSNVDRGEVLQLV